MICTEVPKTYTNYTYNIIELYTYSLYVDIKKESNMTTKLTLTIEKDTIQKAKEYAAKQGRSLSDIVDSYLKSITSNSSINDQVISPNVQSLMGAFEEPKNMDYKAALSKALTDKYITE